MENRFLGSKRISLFLDFSVSYLFIHLHHACSCNCTRWNGTLVSTRSPLGAHKLAAQLRNASFSTGHNGPQEGVAEEEAAGKLRIPDRIVYMLTHACSILTIRSRTHPAHLPDSLRTRDTERRCTVCVTRAHCVHPCHTTCLCSLPACTRVHARSHALTSPVYVRITRTRLAERSTRTCTCRPAYHLIAISEKLR